MERKIKKFPAGLTAAALVLTAVLAVGGAMGYFTTYSTASGGVTLNMGFTETIPDETVDEDGKHINIRNVGDYDCFVRARAYSTLELGYEPGDGWSYNEDDGYWYYGDVLEAGATTATELLVTYTLPAAEKDSEGNTLPREDVDITVVQECTPVLYDENGNAYADWTRTVTDAE